MIERETDRQDRWARMITALAFAWIEERMEDNPDAPWADFAAADMARNLAAAYRPEVVYGQS